MRSGAQIAAAAARMSPGVDIHPELDALGKRLRSGEVVREMAAGWTAGTAGHANALLVLTDQRVLLLRERSDHQTSKAVALKGKLSIWWDPGPSWGTLTITDPHSEMRVAQIALRDGERLVTLIDSITAEAGARVGEVAVAQLAAEQAPNPLPSVSTAARPTLSTGQPQTRRAVTQRSINAWRDTPPRHSTPHRAPNIPHRAPPSHVAPLAASDRDKEAAEEAPADPDPAGLAS